MFLWVLVLPRKHSTMSMIFKAWSGVRYLTTVLIQLETDTVHAGTSGLGWNLDASFFQRFTFSLHNCSKMYCTYFVDVVTSDKEIYVCNFRAEVSNSESYWYIGNFDDSSSFIDKRKISQNSLTFNSFVIFSVLIAVTRPLDHILSRKFLFLHLLLMYLITSRNTLCAIWWRFEVVCHPWTGQFCIQVPPCVDKILQ